MREYLILSGKGGSGKTSIAASFAVLAENCVISDCDVDAADMHLLLVPEQKKCEDFFSGWEPFFNNKECVTCGRCADLCRYNAIEISDGKLKFDRLSCEGCGVCSDNCPGGAISLKKRFCGHIYESSTAHGPMVGARLEAGGENSGKLVSEVRKKARSIANAIGAEYIISDGPPGIGCPAISALSGVDKVLLVTEPTVSGYHDLERIYKLCNHFKVPANICVNKYDLNMNITEKIKWFAAANNASFIGRVPYDKSVTNAQMEAKTVVEQNESKAADNIKKIWERFKNG